MYLSLHSITGVCISNSIFETDRQTDRQIDAGARPLLTSLDCFESRFLVSSECADRGSYKSLFYVLCTRSAAVFSGPCSEMPGIFSPNRQAESPSRVRKIKSVLRANRTDWSANLTCVTDALDPVQPDHYHSCPRDCNAGICHGAAIFGEDSS